MLGTPTCNIVAMMTVVKIGAKPSAEARLNVPRNGASAGGAAAASGNGAV